MSRGNGTHPLTCPLRVTHSPECVLSLWFSTNQYLRIILPALYGFGHGDHSLDRPSEINWSPREISFRTSSLIAWTGMWSSRIAGPYCRVGSRSVRQRTPNEVVRGVHWRGADARADFARHSGLSLRPRQEARLRQRLCPCWGYLCH